MFADAEAFTNFANSFRSGYLKFYKGHSMFETMYRDLPAIRKDSVRLRNYLTNSLEMEGFRSDTIERIARGVEQND